MLDTDRAHRREYEVDRRSGPIVTAEAPGRLHFLGEHGEPGAGLFLSSAIDRSVRVTASLRKDASLRFFDSAQYERKRTTLAGLKFRREDRWANHLKVAVRLFADMGCPAQGLNFTVASDIPPKLGLASAQAVETAAALALKGLFQTPMSDRTLLKRLLAAKTALYEREFSPVDYLIMLNAKEDAFLVVDEAEAKAVRVKSPLTEYRILLMDSRVPLAGTEAELKQRLRDVKRGKNLLREKRPGAEFGDYTSEDLLEFMGDFPEAVRRRCSHIVQEIQRVREAEAAMKRRDIPALARIFCRSHESLRDLYEVSCPETDWLVKRAQETADTAGARMAGQGFGGCIYTFIKETAIAEYLKLMKEYERFFGFRPVSLELRQGSGARIVEE
ncbi:MAG: galactokinase [Treponematales bacterium]